MSGRGGRGGRGGGRGGAAGRGKAAPPGMPFGDDPTLVAHSQPSETYPSSYKPPLAPVLTDREARSVACFVAFRQAYHDTPFYTHRHLSVESVSATDPVLRLYGQSQINARYGIKNRATMDPFLAVPMYSHQFVDESRTLPELKGARPYVKDLFPEELWATMDGKDAGGPKGGYPAKAKEKKGTKRKSLADRGDDDLFVDDDDDEFGSHKRLRNETEEQRKARIEGAGKEGENEDVEAGEELEDEEEELSQEDDDYEDDEDGGDYDAEAYFDGGDDDDYGDDEGVGESAMDF
ncbi:DNA-directed RNA polymerase III, subunit Rpc31 [Biscogniauxia sp. FL1348]|nr:DNA-directed RNA polymerase III, subunit Rpc31 [Biscogniauxia sp. FL1348]